MALEATASTWPRQKRLVVIGAGIAAIVVAIILVLAFRDPNIPIPIELRMGSFPCSRTTAQTSLELKHAGWTYVMPSPKSAQARWGNTDGRTTWWKGYWVHESDRASSESQPKKNANGAYVGDGKGGHSWRKGGTPPCPTKIEWLCSKSGGIEPR